MTRHNNNKITFSSMMLLAVLLVPILNRPVYANIRTLTDAAGLIEATCPAGSKKSAELDRLKQEIGAARSVDEARRLALAPTDDAITALRNARNLMPFSEDLQTAESRLDNARSRIMLASSQEQVADEFDGMMLAGLDNDRAASVNVGSGSCNYSTGELIGIAIGLILGIIPGLILLVVLC